MVEVAQVEGIMMCLGEAIMDYSMNKRVAKSVGNRDIHGGAPYGTYRCKGEDRWVNISVSNEEEWQGFCCALKNPEWAKNERFNDALSRYHNQDELDKHVHDWTIKQDNPNRIICLCGLCVFQEKPCMPMLKSTGSKELPCIYTAPLKPSLIVLNIVIKSAWMWPLKRSKIVGNKNAVPWMNFGKTAEFVGFLM